MFKGLQKYPKFEIGDLVKYAGQANNDELGIVVKVTVWNEERNDVTYRVYWIRNSFAKSGYTARNLVKI